MDIEAQVAPYSWKPGRDVCLTQSDRATFHHWICDRVRDRRNPFWWFLSLRSPLRRRPPAAGFDERLRLELSLALKVNFDRQFGATG
jgi:hypothetical protein